MPGTWLDEAPVSTGKGGGHFLDEGLPARETSPTGPYQQPGTYDDKLSHAFLSDAAKGYFDALQAPANPDPNQSGFIGPRQEPSIYQPRAEPAPEDMRVSPTAAAEYLGPSVSPFQLYQRSHKLREFLGQPPEQGPAPGKEFPIDPMALYDAARLAASMDRDKGMLGKLGGFLSAVGGEAEKQALGTLIPSIPRIQARPDAPLAVKGVAATVNELSGIAEGVLSPAGILTLGGAGLASAGAKAALSGVWALYMGTRAVPQAVVELKRAIQSGDAQNIIEASETLGVLGLFTRSAAKHALEAKVPGKSLEGTPEEVPALNPAAQNYLRMTQPNDVPVGHQDFLRLLPSDELANPNAGAVSPSNVPYGTLGEPIGPELGPQPDPNRRSSLLYDTGRPRSPDRPASPSLPVQEIQPTEISPAKIGPAEQKRLKIQPLEIAPTGARSLRRGSRIEPGVIHGTDLEAWADRVIGEDPRTRTQIGLDPTGEARRITAFVIKGASLIEQGAKTFGPWSERMVSEYGEIIRPNLDELWRQSQQAFSSVMGNEIKLPPLKQRKLAQRGMGAPDVPEDLRQKMVNDPASYYLGQTMPTLEDAISKMSEDDLRGIPMISPDGPNNAWVAAQAELFKRKMVTNEEAAWKIFENAMKMGTSFGQLVNQYKLFPDSSPDGLMVLMNRRLKSGGFDALTPAQQVDFRDLSRRSIAANLDWRQAERNWRGDPTDANFAAVEAAHQAALEHSKNFQERIRAYEPREFWGQMKSLMQGGLLVPPSLIANVVGNLSNLIPRGNMRGLATWMDALEAQLRSRERTMATSPVKGLGVAVKAGFKALRQSGQILLHGGSDLDLAQANYRRPLQPLIALRDAFTNPEFAPRKGGKYPVSQRALALIEGGPNSLSALMFRSLGASDVPFREGARARIVRNELKVMQLNNLAAIRKLERAIGRSPEMTTELETRRAKDAMLTKYTEKTLRYPELFFNPEQIARIHAETLKAVFQQPNALSNFFLRGTTRGEVGAWNFALSTVAPYVMTPSNVAIEIAKWQPGLSFGELVYRLAKKDSRGAKEAASRVIVGGMIAYAANWMYKQGLISPSLDDPTEQNKGRMLSNDVFRPGHINISALKRVMGQLAKGEPVNGSWQPGDETRDMIRGGGIVGSLFLAVANGKRSMERRAPEDEGWLDAGTSYLARQALLTSSYVINQTYMRGTANLLTAITEGPAKVEDWVRAYWEGVSSMAFPQVLNTWTKATRDYAKVVKDDSLTQSLKNVVMNRLGGISGVFGKRTDTDLPDKIGLWGEPIEQTPAGLNRYFYQFIDITKPGEIPGDPLSLALYDIWRATSNDQVIPTPPDANFSYAGKTFKLDQLQLEELRIAVGQERKKIGDMIVNNRAFNTANPDIQAKELAAAWEVGNGVGSARFYKKFRAGLQEKQKPAGFQP